jgi:hypothetical protein
MRGTGSARRSAARSSDDRQTADTKNSAAARGARCDAAAYSGTTSSARERGGREPRENRTALARPSGGRDWTSTIGQYTAFSVVQLPAKEYEFSDLEVALILWGRWPVFPGNTVEASIIDPVLTMWRLRPVRRADRVSELRAVVWKSL